ncbi:thiamine diphosphate-binding protein [Halenospora varia]|nr:thiamine diphosphate-binding protein [Halenospora varia]
MLPFAVKYWSMLINIYYGLYEIRIRHHFVVPGDYNLILLDKLSLYPKLTEVGCANKLNCSMAAKGYACAKGVLACIVTYKNLPLILISGSPNTNNAGKFHLLHRMLGEHDFTYQYKMAMKITCCATVTDPVPSNKGAMAAAIDQAAQYLDGKKKPMILVGPKIHRAGAEKEQLKLAKALGMLAADPIVHWADAIIRAGTASTDYSTVGWTALPNIPHMVAKMNHMTFPGAHFSHVRLCDFLLKLAEIVTRNNTMMIKYRRLRPNPPIERFPNAEEALTRKELRLPQGADFEVKMQWGHIRWSIPASFGYTLGKRDQKIVVIVGDGLFQVTAQEVSQMVEIHDRLYNRIKNWNYNKLVEAFNSIDGHALGLQVATVGELAVAMEKAQGNTEGPTLIKCALHQDNYSRELITWGHFVAAANARPATYS